MHAAAGLPRPPLHHLPAECQEVLQADLEVDSLWPPIHDGNHVDGKAGLEGGVLVQGIEDDVWRGAPFGLHHYAHALAVTFIPHIGDA